MAAVTSPPRAARLAGIVLLLFLAAFPGAASAKRVVCIDGGGDGFLTNKEGFFRARNVAGNVVSVGGNLTDCLAQVAAGDELVIGAHGGNNGAHFVWGGQNYTGFGSGQGQMALPPGFDNLSRVSVSLCMCFSDRDPDGDGPDKSLVDKMKAAMGGANNNNTVTGYRDAVECTVGFTVSGGTPAQRAAATRCLESNVAWANNPPVNRPNAMTTQLTAAQAQISMANCPGAGGVVTVAIPNRFGNRGDAGYQIPNERLPDPQGGCACEVCPSCGCGSAEAVEEAVAAQGWSWGLLKARYWPGRAPFGLSGSPRGGP